MRGQAEAFLIALLVFIFTVAMVFDLGRDNGFWQ